MLLPKELPPPLGHNVSFEPLLFGHCSSQGIVCVNSMFFSHRLYTELMGQGCPMNVGAHYRGDDRDALYGKLPLWCNQAWPINVKYCVHTYMSERPPLDQQGTFTCITINSYSASRDN